MINEKVLVFIAFVYNYYMYQIPLKLMNRASEDLKRVREEFEATRDMQHVDELTAVMKRLYKWMGIVEVRQAKCDYYRDIIES